MIYEGEIVCPHCGGLLHLYDHVMRTVRMKRGEKEYIYIRRMRCTECGKIHRELPTHILPYIQYDNYYISPRKLYDETGYIWKGERY